MGELQPAAPLAGGLYLAEPHPRARAARLAIPVGLLCLGLSINTLESYKPKDTPCSLNPYLPGCATQSVSYELTKVAVTGTSVMGGLAIVTGSILVGHGLATRPRPASPAAAVQVTFHISKDTAGLLAAGRF